MSIPIPARCAHRPVQGGLVVPYISVTDGDGRAYLGAVHRTRNAEVIRDGLCQVCGQSLGTPVVVLVRESDLPKRYSAEPPTHPECAAYSQRACPMLAGHMQRYRDSVRHVGKPCPDPNCNCGGWTLADAQSPSRSGAPAEPWYAVWLPYVQIAINDAREIHGVAWHGIEPLKVRPVPRAEARADA